MAKVIGDWGRKRLSEAARVNRWLIRKGLTWDDIEERLKENKREERRIGERSSSGQTVKEAPKYERCPNCPKGGVLLPFMLRNEDGTVDTVMKCSRKCGYSRYDGRPMEEILAELNDDGN